ncbi:hypothetical protein [Flavobacterium sp.]|uniref:hypothetical protein n=1 Tax=Flavobacterium sp. TaxID=239 RepID=UPI003D09681B
MKRNFVYIIICLSLLSSCNYFTDDFFEFLFNTKDIHISRECSKTPSFFDEGRSFEVYSMIDVNPNMVKKNIVNKSNFLKSDKYPKYNIPEWEKTPVVNKMDSVYSFIHSEMIDEKNICFDENNLITILKQEGNYYAFLYDNIGRAKLFIWDVKKKKLFLLTSYEL